MNLVCKSGRCQLTKYANEPIMWSIGLWWDCCDTSARIGQLIGILLAPSSGGIDQLRFAFDFNETTPRCSSLHPPPPPQPSNICWNHLLVEAEESWGTFVTCCAEETFQQWGAQPSCRIFQFINDDFHDEVLPDGNVTMLSACRIVCSTKFILPNDWNLMWVLIIYEFVSFTSRKRSAWIEADKRSEIHLPTFQLRNSNWIWRFTTHLMQNHIYDRILYPKAVPVY